VPIRNLSADSIYFHPSLSAFNNEIIDLLASISRKGLLWYLTMQICIIKSSSRNPQGLVLVFDKGKVASSNPAQESLASAIRLKPHPK
jgi:hypothetical protein